MTTTPNNSIKFSDLSAGMEEVIRLDKEGFHYRDQFIADAGEAHRLLVEYLKRNIQPEPEGPTDEEWKALKDRLLDRHKTVGYQGEVFIYDRDFDVALDDVRQELARWGRPAIKPVPVSERPWEREGWCDAQGKCWFGAPPVGDRLGYGAAAACWILRKPSERLYHQTASLPHHAMPVPPEVTP